MHVLVANATHQFVDFHYRIPEFSKVFSAVVPPGRQLQLPVDFNETQLLAVVEQLERIGAVPAAATSSLATPRGLVYSTRRPVTTDQIESAREKDESIRQKIADQQVENAGVAAFTPAAGDKLQSSTLEVRELAPTNAEDPVKGGVDVKIVVSKRAGAKERKRG